MGLGGRLDATNIIHPTCCIITSIDYDHQAFLGSTIQQITTEKAGIIKSTIPVITTSTQRPETIEILKQTCADKKSHFIVTKPLPNTQQLGLKGSHQHSNAALANACIRHCFPTINQNQINTSLNTTSHWGRFSIIKYNNSTIIVDAAHNPAGATTLCENMQKLFPDQLPVVIFGLNKAKSWQPILKILETLSSHLYYCYFDNQFSVPLQIVQNDTTASLKEYKLNTPLPNKPLIVITGSIYFIGHFYNKLNK